MRAIPASRPVVTVTRIPCAAADAAVARAAARPPTCTSLTTATSAMPARPGSRRRPSPPRRRRRPRRRSADLIERGQIVSRDGLLDPRDVEGSEAARDGGRPSRRPRRRWRRSAARAQARRRGSRRRAHGGVDARSDLGLRRGEAVARGRRGPRRHRCRRRRRAARSLARPRECTTEQVDHGASARDADQVVQRHVDRHRGRRTEAAHRTEQVIEARRVRTREPCTALRRSSRTAASTAGAAAGCGVASPSPRRPAPSTDLHEDAAPSLDRAVCGRERTPQRDRERYESHRGDRHQASPHASSRPKARCRRAVAASAALSPGPSIRAQDRAQRRDRQRGAQPATRTIAGPAEDRERGGEDRSASDEHAGVERPPGRASESHDERPLAGTAIAVHVAHVVDQQDGGGETADGQRREQRERTDATGLDAAPCRRPRADRRRGTRTPRRARGTRAATVRRCRRPQRRGSPARSQRSASRRG